MEDILSQLSEGSRAGYLDLINVGKMARSFEWAGHTFIIKSLNLEEEIAIGQLIKPYAGTITEEKAAVAAIAAACIESIDGNPLMVRITKDPVAHLQEKFKMLVSNWYWPVVKRINEEYSYLQDEVSKSMEEFVNLSEEGPMSNLMNYTEDSGPSKDSTY